MSEDRRVPAPFIQTVNEQGEIVDVKPPTCDVRTFYWKYRLSPDFRDDLQSEHGVISDPPAQNWPPILKPREEE